MYVRLDDLDTYLQGKTGRSLSYVFGVAGAIILSGLGYTLWENWHSIRRDLGSEAAVVAQDVLADEELRGQLEQLSKMLVSTLLKDETTVATITTFVQQILENNDIRCDRMTAFSMVFFWKPFLV